MQAMTYERHLEHLARRRSNYHNQSSSHPDAINRNEAAETESEINNDTIHLSDPLIDTYISNQAHRQNVQHVPMCLTHVRRIARTAQQITIGVTSYANITQTNCNIHKL